MRRLSAWLAAAAVAGVVRGDTQAAEAAKAAPASLSVADFDTRIQQAGVVPEVFNSLDPSLSFYASYVADTGASELLLPGSSLSVNGNISSGGPRMVELLTVKLEAQLPFEFSVENTGNVSGISALTRYIIFLV